MKGIEGRIIAVVGGDGREREIARAACLAGAEVRTFAVPGPLPTAVRVAASLRGALSGADAVIFPIPLPTADGAIFAPAAGEAIVPSPADFAVMKEGAVIVTGRASLAMREAARQWGLQLYEYEEDEELMLLRAPAIAEGAIAVAIRETEVTLHRSPCLVVGFGKVGPSLARTLLGMGARVTVAARNPVQRARALAFGCDAIPLTDVEAVLPQMAVVFNTVPVTLFQEGWLKRIGEGTVLIDISGPPGGVDREAAARLGVRYVWARGLGGRAPRTVGESQWQGIARHLARFWEVGGDA